MTTYDYADITCALCGYTASHQVLTSTSSFALSDLDTRPAPLARYELAAEVLECPTCGCVWPADDPQLPLRDGVRTLVASDAYRSIKLGYEESVLADRFRQLAAIHEALGEIAAAGFAQLRAAWVCDDAEVPEAAEACRMMAAGYLEIAYDRGDWFIEAVDPARRRVSV